MLEIDVILTDAPAPGAHDATLNRLVRFNVDRVEEYPPGQDRVFFQRRLAPK